MVFRQVWGIRFVVIKAPGEGEDGAGEPKCPEAPSCLQWLPFAELNILCTGLLKRSPFCDQLKHVAFSTPK